MDPPLFVVVVVVGVFACPVLHSTLRSSPLFGAAIRASFIWNEMSFLVIIVVAVAGTARHGAGSKRRTGAGRDPDLPPRRRAVPDAI